MNTTSIEWTDKTWNPVTGCTAVSPGCKNCYAEKIYERWNGHGTFRNVQTHPERLNQPLKWKKPSKIFVNSMSDLFHEDVDFDFIDNVWMAMRKCNHHTFQILTKRPKRMLDFFKWKTAGVLGRHEPLPNVWLGVSVENQQTADERIPLLLQTPAAIRFLSCEPLLGKINLLKIPVSGGFINCLTGAKPAYPQIDWVIVGGESGPSARPMHPEWVRNLLGQCQSEFVPFFFKQWGEYAPIRELRCNEPGIKGKKWFNFDPETSVCKVGKKTAGNLIDGIRYDDYPGKKGFSLSEHRPLFPHHEIEAL